MSAFRKEIDPYCKKHMIEARHNATIRHKSPTLHLLPLTPPPFSPPTLFETPKIGSFCIGDTSHKSSTIVTSFATYTSATLGVEGVDAARFSN